MDYYTFDVDVSSRQASFYEKDDMNPELPCQEAHAKLIAGICPWCQRPILHGEPVGEGGLPRIIPPSELKQLIREKLIAKLDTSKLGTIDSDTLRAELRLVIERICETVNPLMTRQEQAILIDEILDEMFPNQSGDIDE